MKLRMAGLVLAAGFSRRMAGRDKLVCEVGGVPLLRRAVVSLLDAGLSPVVVALPADNGAARLASLAGLDVRTVTVHDPERGMGRSLAVGVAALCAEGDELDAVAILPGDMPWVASHTVRALAERFQGCDKSIVCPTFKGRRGHPVLFDLSRHGSALSELDEEQGGRSLLVRYADEVDLCPVDDEGVLLDVDTEEDLSRDDEQCWRSTSLADALEIDSLEIGLPEIVSLVGGGGKTTLMYALLRELRGRGINAAAATTAKIRTPKPQDGARLILGETEEALTDALRQAQDQAFVLGRRLLEDDKVEGIDPDWCGELVREGGLDVLIVEADGSAGRPLKAPESWEPPAPQDTTLWVAVAGLSVVGQPLGPETVHRPERVCAVGDMEPGQPIEVEGLLRVLASADGLLKGKPPGARAVAFLNQADDDERNRLGVELASKLLERSPDYCAVLVTSLLDPVKGVYRQRNKRQS